MGYKYLCTGGYIIASGGSRHYINERQLPELYKVPITDCLYAPKIVRLSSDFSNLLQLIPRAAGDYEEYLKILKTKHLLENE